MILITGDLHGSLDISKFSVKRFPMQKELTRSDHVIICGDFGLLWNGSAESRYWLDWLDKKPWTTLWIDGNHENFDMLKEYPKEDWNGGQIQKITDNIFHLCRGSVFELEGKRIFAFGGAESHDKEYRTLGKTMWEEELPSIEELRHGWNALEEVGWQVDVVVTHSLPQRIQKLLFGEGDYCSNILTAYFDEIDAHLDFKLWFSGHYHCSAAYDETHYLIYNNIVKLTESGFERVYPLPVSEEYAQNSLLDIR